MPHGKTQFMFVYPSLNVALVEVPQSTNLQMQCASTNFRVGIAFPFTIYSVD